MARDSFDIIIIIIIDNQRFSDYHTYNIIKMKAGIPLFEYDESEGFKSDFIIFKIGEI